ncbi:MAG TPA: HdeD protein [Agrobacterium sp.]|nr:HdeD protein [Agrobacterium sp.]
MINQSIKNAPFHVADVLPGGKTEAQTVLPLHAPHDLDQIFGILVALCCNRDSFTATIHGDSEMTHSLNAPGFSPLRAKWGWFLALGLVLLAFGVIALGNLLVATVASVFYVGVMMLMGGILQLFHAFQVKGWESVLFWTLSGLLYAIAGVIAFQNPDLTAAVLTLLMAVSLVIAGIFRLVVGFRLKPATGWGWVAVAGAVTALAGLVIAAGWPVNSLWVLGLFLAIDLIMQGFAMIALAMAMRT